MEEEKKRPRGRPRVLTDEQRKQNYRDYQRNYRNEVRRKKRELVEAQRAAAPVRHA